MGDFGVGDVGAEDEAAGLAGGGFIEAETEPPEGRGGIGLGADMMFVRLVFCSGE